MFSAERDVESMMEGVEKCFDNVKRNYFKQWAGWETGYVLDEAKIKLGTWLASANSLLHSVKATKNTYSEMFSADPMPPHLNISQLAAELELPEDSPKEVVLEAIIKGTVIGISSLSHYIISPDLHAC